MKINSIISSHFRSEKGRWSLVVLSAVLAFFFTALTWFIFHDGGAFVDEGSYCTIATGILHGGLPYRDYFNEKAPLQYFWTAAIMALSDEGIDGARLASSLTLSATLFLLFWQLIKHQWGLLITTVWLGIVILLGWMMSIHSNTTESSLALLFVMSAVLSLGVAATPLLTARKAFFIGILQGLACGFRQHAAAPALLLLFAPWLKNVRRFYFYGGAAGLLIWLGLITYLGIFNDFLEAAVLFHFDNNKAGSYFRGLQMSVTGLVSFGAWLVLLIGFYLSPGSARHRIFLIIWAVLLALPFFGRMDEFRLWPSVLFH